MVIVVGGDIGLSGSDQPVSAKGAYRHGARYDWADLTRHLGLLVNGDINFANLETVVTDKNSLPPTPKKFRFRSHPVGVQHLVKLGFNAFSLANNHAIDYGHALLDARAAALADPAMRAGFLTAVPEHRALLDMQR